MQRVKLLKLADYVENLPRAAKKRFNMRVWGSRPRGQKVAEKQRIDPMDCGTAGCLMGWATSCFPASKLILRFGWGNSGGDIEYPMSRGKARDRGLANWWKDGTVAGFGAAQAFFGLTYMQAAWLFDPDRYRGRRYTTAAGKITPRFAAKRIRDFVKDPSCAEG